MITELSPVNYIKNPLACLLFIGTITVGLFYEPLGAVLTVVLAVLLLCDKKNGQKGLPLDLTLITLAVFCLLLLLSALWGVDKYYSLLGFVKFFPLLLFYIYIGRQDNDTVTKALDVIPLAGVIMVLVSFPLSKIAATQQLFSVKGRISGFFQYPSTFALFLIIGIIILSVKEHFTTLHAMGDVVLMLGVFLSGSRTSFIVLVITLVGLLFVAKKKQFKLFIIAAFTAVVVLAVVYYLVSDDKSSFSRFLMISGQSVTLKGRLLYFKDAVKVILKHPLGLGYMGYYFAQGSFQSGVYANQFVHNELLQLLLDAGWLPAVLGIIAVVKAFFSKHKEAYQKLIILVILLHAMMDFDLQYLIIVFILLICLRDEEMKHPFTLAPPVKVCALLLIGTVCILSLYLGSSAAFYLASKSDSAVKICKYHTMAQIERLEATDDISQKKEIAETIIKNDRYISNAYSSLALYDYTEGDVEQTIQHKKLAIQNARYGYEEYVDYAGMLMNVTGQYLEAGDENSAVYCIQKMKELKATIEEVKDSTDTLAYELNDKPQLELPKEYSDAMDYYIALLQ